MTSSSSTSKKPEEKKSETSSSSSSSTSLLLNEEELKKRRERYYSEASSEMKSLLSEEGDKKKKPEEVLRIEKEKHPQAGDLLQQIEHLLSSKSVLRSLARERAISPLSPHPLFQIESRRDLSGIALDHT
ncbi:hypothetical protein CSUI_010888 [Cystoisospora suis]|uniref:Uncharacterized protein n=1 Tax=Cystoisospora suis TaxID=483139 RepID=A0A2C6JVH7_9APIC|nr:hypothetical protein CSUI_010888 [Cystoisospora suis]